jgi:RNA polymerase sigma factor (sigma-70 family)
MRHQGVRENEFAEFYEQTRDRCLRSAIAYGMQADRAEDAVAEAYAKAWASWGKVRKCNAPAAWVFRTAVNTDISWWRRQRREVLSEPHEVALPEANALHDHKIDLAAAITLLSVRQREVVVLHYLLDLDLETTACWLGLATGTVKSHLHAARNELRLRINSEKELQK